MKILEFLKKEFFFFSYSKRKRVTCNKVQETIFASNNLQGPDEDLARILEKQNPARNHMRFLRSREEQDRCFLRLLRPKRLTLNSKNRKRKKNEKGFGKEQNVKGSISRGE